MIFLTVGTLFSFDRLVRAIDDACGDDLFDEKVFGQTGTSSYKPRNFEYVEMLNKYDFDLYLTSASSLISHAGMGSIIMALNHEKPLLVMPRLKCFGEHVNDHQVGTARKFEQLGHILVAYNEEDLAEKIKQLKSFVPLPRENQAKAVVDRISRFLNEL